MAYVGSAPNPGQNREVDDISSSFDGSTTAFTLKVGGSNASPGSSNNIIVSLGGVVQNPGNDYTVAASTITFTTAPAAGLSFFGVVLGQQIDVATLSDGTSPTVNDLKANTVKGVSASTAAITLNSSDGTCTANIANNLGHKNFIINGGMEVAQRGTAQSTVDTSAGYRSVDRWKTDIDGGSVTGRFTHGQSTDVPANLGFRKSSKIVVSTTQSQPATDAFNQFYYLLERQDVGSLAWGSSSAKTCTLSFYVKSSVAGTYSLFFQWYGDSGAMYFYYTSYTITSANTWERKTITLTGPTVGGLEDTDINEAGFRIEWGLGYASDTETGNLNEWTTSTTRRTPSGHVYLPENSGAEWFITGVQFEVSPVVTDFERCPIYKTLEYCQRYYQRHDYVGSGGFSGALLGFYNVDTDIRVFYNCRVIMRATPTLEYSALSDFDVEPRDRAISNLSIDRANERQVCLQSSGLTDDNGKGEAACLTLDQTDGFIAFNAEL